MIDLRRNPKDKYTCDECNEKFRLAMTLVSHKREEHPKFRRSKFDRLKGVNRRLY